MIKLYTVVDKASGTSNHPMPFTTERDARDGLAQVVNDPQTSIAKHPDDFDLFHLGDYNPREMSFDLHDKPLLICNAKQLLKVSINN